MDEVVELENVETVCRLCLTVEDPKSSIFSVQDSAVSLAAKIQACVSVQVSPTDRLSTIICGSCVKSINQWYTYRESCLKSQDKLQQWLANHSHATPTVVTIKDEPVDLDFYEDNMDVLSENTVNNSEHSDILMPSVHDIQTVSEDGGEHLPHPEQDAQKEKQPIIPIDNTEKKADKDDEQVDKEPCTLPIKEEPVDDYDTDCTIEIESATGSELLLSPVTSGKEDVVMEADSTQKSNTASSASKKKSRRGPHTHFRGPRVFIQKCTHCQINLHSKYSYSKHMERFHSDDLLNDSSKSISQEEEELIEDLEDELVSMEIDAPLTQVQQNIISQLKTFECYSCQQMFTDRRTTLAHIRQHMPDLRPYTCIACLTEFPDRSMYKLHCEASFECAMKIALVVPKHGNEKYFTCNMCLRPLSNRKELLSHLSKHSDKQYEELMAPTRSPPKLKPMEPIRSTKEKSLQGPVVPSPYKNGDPAHNHLCDLCGMIYRYKPNMLKHRELCLRLLPEVRTSYKCVHCGMTFLVFNKFHSHLATEHKKKEYACAQCGLKFKLPSEFLAHHESHRVPANGGRKSLGDESDSSKSPHGIQSPLNDWNTFEEEVNLNRMRISSQKYSCALCGQEFPTRAKLTEHRNLHLKVKIYSCVICRSMFSSAGALEIHMKDHGIEDPNERNANSSCVEYAKLDEDSQDVNSMNTSTISDPGSRNVTGCEPCGKIFSNYANLRRHIRNVHKTTKARYTCSECPRTFKSKEVCNRHLQVDHKSPKPMLQCPQCPKSFVFRANLNLHCQSAHGASQGKQSCDICGKVFLEEASLKIHKGWHNRANSRLNSRFSTNTSDNRIKMSSSSSPEKGTSANSTPTTSGDRPARARKSFPNSSAKPLVAQPQKNLQCQVCDDNFTEVTELRKHLWDVHCARNKPEKSFSGDELQCQLCTNVFPDQETLKLHMQWHKAHPILSDMQKQSYPCEVCGKHYSSRKVLYRHRRLHKATTVASIKFQSLARKPHATQFLCTICRKVFCSNQSLQRHKMNIHRDLFAQRVHHQQSNLAEEDEEEEEEEQGEEEEEEQTSPVNSSSSVANASRRPSIEEPKAKRVKVEAEDGSSKPVLVPNPVASGEKKKPVMCHVCKKHFPNMSVLYKHKQLVHKPRMGRATTRPVQPVLECLPMVGKDGKVACNVCYKQFSGLTNLKQHFSIKHRKKSNFACHIDGCNTTCPTPRRLKSHEIQHSSMIYSCNLCDRHVFSRGAMSEHMVTVHNTSYDAATNKSFHRETDLRFYEVEGAVNATCPHCKIKYPNNKAMKIHYFKFHDAPESKWPAGSSS